MTTQGRKHVQFVMAKFRGFQNDLKVFAVIAWQ